MISKTLDTMISKMEQSTDEDHAVAASCLRIDVKRWAEDHACYRCPKAGWMAGPMPSSTRMMGQPAVHEPLKWQLVLGACGAFLPVIEHFPAAPFFCSAQKTDEAGSGFAAAAEERQRSSGAGWGETQTPRELGQGEGQ